MCITFGQHAATAEYIFDKTDQVLSLHHNAWDDCVVVGVEIQVSILEGIIQLCTNLPEESKCLNYGMPLPIIQPIML